MQSTVHEGRNVKRFREMRNLKQEALADMLGDDWSQKKISQIEQREIVDPALLSQVAKALELPIEAFQTLTEEQVVNIISNTINNHDQSAVVQYSPVFNPVEKWMDALEEIKRLNEARLKDKDEHIKTLEKMLEKMMGK